MAEFREYCITAAIDFGTTYSGYAFSTLNDYNKDPLKIYECTWYAGTTMTKKTSTCVLFDPDWNFAKFGFEAEDKYSELALDNEHEDWYFFRRFKLGLYGEKNINRNTEIKDECGKTMTAMKVFSAGIEYLKNRMMDACKTQLTGMLDDDIRWVLTVPAIWSDSAKQFMREAAEQAGICTDHLLVALEPEVASIFCRHIPVKMSSCKTLEGLEKGSKYIVLDAGGGTIDITVHEVQQDESLREIHKANGGDWGGTKVDDKFESALKTCFGCTAFTKFCCDQKYDYLELLREFERSKRNLEYDSDKKFRIKIPATLIECGKPGSRKGDVTQQVKSKHDINNTISVRGDKLIAEHDVIRDMFIAVADNIVDHLKNLLQHKNVKEVNSILMVGGFSESKILQEIIKRNFEQLRVIIPAETGQAVLKGAVIFGHDTKIIKSRISKVTYGVKAIGYYDPKKDPLCNRFETIDGKIKCRNIFDIHVREGDTVMAGKPQPPLNYRVTEADQKGMNIEIWTSDRRQPQYTNDVGCHLLGSLHIDIPDTSRGLKRSVDIQMTFGGTELKVDAKERCSGESVSATFDFLK